MVKEAETAEALYFYMLVISWPRYRLDCSLLTGIMSFILPCTCTITQAASNFKRVIISMNTHMHMLRNNSTHTHTWAE